MSSPVKIFTAQRNANSSSQAQRELGKQMKRAHLKMKKRDQKNTDENEHQALDHQRTDKKIIGEEVVVEKPETNCVEGRFIKDFTFTLTLDEIEDDLFLMTGNPVKGNLHPGNRLDEVCAAINELEGEAALQKN